MKKLFSLFNMTALAVAVLFSSCSKSDDPKPAPTIDAYIGTAGKTEVTGAGPVAITYNATATEGITKIDAVSMKGATGSQTTNNLPDFPKTGKFTSSTTDNGTIPYSFTGMDATQIKITVTDKNGATASKTIDINKGGTSTGTDISTYSAVLLGSQKSTSPSFFATSNGTPYTEADAKKNPALIDFVYYFGKSNLATIGAPNNSDVNTIYPTAATTLKNATLFSPVTLSATEFDAITKDNIATKAGTPTNTDAKSLKVGDVIAFKTAAGKLGLFRVKDQKGIFDDASGSITIDVKVQK